MDIDFELYKVFYHVARDLSFSEASAKLYISQSAVSQAIKNLEQKMKCRLFIRNTKQVKLTQEGDILFKYVEQAFNFIKQGEKSLIEVRTLERGEISIGATDSICKYYLMPYFKKFIEQFPKIKINVVNRTSPECMKLLQNGMVDLVVVNLPRENPDKNLNVKMLKPVQDVFIAGPSYKEFADKVLDIHELEHFPLLMLEKNTSSRAYIDSFLAEHGIKVTPEIELSSIDLLIELAKIGLGISVVVSDYVQKSLDNKELILVRTKQAIPPRSLGVVTNNKVPTPLAAQMFIEILANAQ